MSKKTGFKCEYCRKVVTQGGMIGTAHRNHCPECLWSKHVDLIKAGDRKAKCGAGMRPIGLTFKEEGRDKWGKRRPGELMVIHECTECGKISINRIAADDSVRAIEKVFEESREKEDLRAELKKKAIRLLGKEDKTEVARQLYGNVTTREK